nr:hypothetical protein [Desulfobulbaceae bacterium]
MTLPKSNGSFPFLDQNGPFATFNTPQTNTLFSKDNRAFIKTLRGKQLITKYRIIRNQIFDFLDVRSFSEIHQLIVNKDKRHEINRRGYALLGNMFGIEGNARETISTINNYSRTADAVIRYLKVGALSQYAAYVEMTNEIDSTSSPIDLLLILFNPRYHKKARFEAKRKLILMSLAGSIELRERETNIEDNFSVFLNFLNSNVWSSEMLIGELNVSYLLSQHDPKDFTCQEVKTISLADAKKIKAKNGQKLTLIKRRFFRAPGKQIPIYVSIRKKSPEAKVLKLLRKGEENPAVAVDDELGLMAVLDSIADVRTFQRHLTQSAIKADSFMTLEEVSDTLTGGTHNSSNIGSAPGTPMFKFFARMGGMRVEFIIHTNKTYLNYIYQRDISHDEYEIKRIFDSGVADLLFPKEIYYLDMAEVKARQLRLCRRKIEEV